MEFVEGQGILGKIAFPDGEFPAYDRTYLIVTVAEDYLEVLNVSSVKGKERKLAFPSNEKLHLYNPPFLKPSFVKLDSLTRLRREEFDTIHVLNSGRILDAKELKRIKICLENFSK